MEEIVVVSHLRWDWVWQRPQHLISRLAAGCPAWFVEEPIEGDVAEPALRSAEAGPVTRVWLEVPRGSGPTGYERRWLGAYAEQLPGLVGLPTERLVWLYTPLALELVDGLQPSVLVYDVMDDLASFKDASPELVLRQGQALERADLVFTGGRTLHRMATAHRPEGTHAFPSGVELEHWRSAARHRRDRHRPTAGYTGVVDERLDLGLVAGLAEALPDWDLLMVGPVTKIDPSDLPQAANLHWLGHRPYDQLPAVLAGFDVALMPFARNEATRAISPTKTLEYLAAGLPVVSTRIPDVVADCAEVVDLADDAGGFAAACRRLLVEDPLPRHRAAEALLATRTWDQLAADMAALVREAAARPAELPTARRAS